MEEILKILNSGRESLTKEEVEKLIGFIGDKYSSGEFMGSEELNSQITSLMADPRFAEQAREVARKKNINNSIAAGIGVIGGLIDLGLSNEQIRRSEEAINKISKPVAPSVPRRNPILSQQIANAQRDKLDVSSSLAPSQLQILDQYMKDMGVAKTASTGQASTYGSLAQTAANRRNRSALGLAPIASRVRGEADDRLARLLGMRGLEDQRAFSNNMSLYGEAMNQYDQNLNAAGSLGATGRQNRAQSYNNILQSLPQLSGLFGNRRPTQQSIGFGPEVDDYSSRINNSLQGRFDPYSQNQFYFTN